MADDLRHRPAERKRPAPWCDLCDGPCDFTGACAPKGRKIPESTFEAVVARREANPPTEPILADPPDRSATVDKNKGVAKKVNTPQEAADALARIPVDQGGPDYGESTLPEHLVPRHNVPSHKDSTGVTPSTASNESIRSDRTSPNERTCTWQLVDIETGEALYESNPVAVSSELVPGGNVHITFRLVDGTDATITVPVEESWFK